LTAVTCNTQSKRAQSESGRFRNGNDGEDGPTGGLPEILRVEEVADGTVSGEEAEAGQAARQGIGGKA
jgi:hypothetical protein